MNKGTSAHLQLRSIEENFLVPFIGTQLFEAFSFLTHLHRLLFGLSGHVQMCVLLLDSVFLSSAAKRGRAVITSRHHAQNSEAFFLSSNRFSVNGTMAGTKLLQDSPSASKVGKRCSPASAAARPQSAGASLKASEGKAWTLRPQRYACPRGSFAAPRRAEDVECTGERASPEPCQNTWSAHLDDRLQAVEGRVESLERAAPHAGWRDTGD